MSALVVAVDLAQGFQLRYGEALGQPRLGFMSNDSPDNIRVRGIHGCKGQRVRRRSLGAVSS